MRVFLYNLREMFFGERERWFMWLPVLFACGIGVYFLLPEEPSRWIILAVVEILLAAAYVWRHRPGRLAAVLVLTVAALGFADIQLKTIYLSRHGIVPFDRKLYLTGRVSELGRNYRGNPRFVLEDIEDFDGNSLPGRYRVSLTSKSSQPENGRCVELIGTVSAPPHPNMVGGYQMDRKLFYEASMPAAMPRRGRFPSNVQKNRRLLPCWKKPRRIYAAGSWPKSMRFCRPTRPELRRPSLPAIGAA